MVLVDPEHQAGLEDLESEYVNLLETTTLADQEAIGDFVREALRMVMGHQAIA